MEDRLWKPSQDEENLVQNQVSEHEPKVNAILEVSSIKDATNINQIKYKAKIKHIFRRHYNKFHFKDTVS